MSRSRYDERQRVAAQMVIDFRGEGDPDVANASQAAANDPLEAQAMMYALVRLATFLAEEVEQLTGRSFEDAVMKAHESIMGPPRPAPAEGRIFPNAPSDELETGAPIPSPIREGHPVLKQIEEAQDVAAQYTAAVMRRHRAEVTPTRDPLPLIDALQGYEQYAEILSERLSEWRSELPDGGTSPAH